MSLPFPRLPLSAISEVIKSMDTREIFLFSLASKKAASFVMLSIPKNSLSAEFTFRRDGFLFELMPKESIQELLNGCHKHHTSLDIETKIQKEFKCTPPPGGYKFETLGVEYAHWVDPDDFLQCRKLFFIGEFPDLTVEYLNGLLMKIVNLECRLERFIFDMKSIKPSDFPEIVKGLSESAIQQEGAWQGLQFKRKDGLKLLVSLSNGYLDLEEDYL
ncbi:unnamed protein product [Caenorhabditis brenneri]